MALLRLLVPLLLLNPVSPLQFSVPSLKINNVKRPTPLQPLVRPSSTKLADNSNNNNNDGFKLKNLFGGSSNNNLRGSSASSATLPRIEEDKPLHPSVRLERPSPLNSLLNEKASTSKASTSTSTLLPSHPSPSTGTLPNGFSYVILPNPSPGNRFEAHLQVFSGSADELQDQQGIAHLTEHVAYMGSRKRERLFGTGSQTNAYTDFQHTVFYAACPTTMPQNDGTPGNEPMMPLALDALAEVMEARVESSRLEKERAAVLSEMTMVNTIEYRVECAILSTLHRENRLAKRFPIGKEDLIRSWQCEDVRNFHRTHYRPDNVLLYIVGDVDVRDTERVIREKFGKLSGRKHGQELSETVRSSAEEFSKAYDCTVKNLQSWHYPPVSHEFVGKAKIPYHEISPDGYDVNLRNDYERDDKTLNTFSDFNWGDNKVIRPHIYSHNLLQSFSLHLFSKKPVKPIVTVEDFRKSIARRICLAALQIRLNVNSRGGDTPAFNFIEVNVVDSSREGCEISSVDLMSEYNTWEQAVFIAIREIKKLGKYSITNSEFLRYSSSVMSDSAQLASQGENIAHGDQLSYLMETISNGHTFMSPYQAYETTAQAMEVITLNDVGDAAKELSEFITSLADESPAMDGPLVSIACTPLTDDSSFRPCTTDNLIEVIRAAANVEVTAEEEMEVPTSLCSADELLEAEKLNPANWLEGAFTDGTPNTPSDKITAPLTLRRLSNGLRVGAASTPVESQRGHLRILVPGGRIAEKKLGLKNGAMAVGARAMQEGGAFGRFSRNQVELFCVDKLLMVEINCNEEFLTFDFVFPTNEVGSIMGEKAITGTEAALQIARAIVGNELVWENDALSRSKNHLISTHESLMKNLEGSATEKLMGEMTSNDARFVSVCKDDVEAVTLEDAKVACSSQLKPSQMEISIAGDFDINETLELVRKYLGTIPSGEEADTGANDGDYNIPVVGKAIDLEVEITDSDPRAVAYVAGAAPNRWGYFSDGKNIGDMVLERGGGESASRIVKQRRQHPLFGHVVLSLISEIINRRLFSTVREKKQLTYDANFHFTGFEQVCGGYFLITVTASKEKAQEAMEACKSTINDLLTRSPITPDNLESAKRVVKNRHEGDLQSCRYWTEIMSGLQLEGVPKSGPLSVTDFSAMVDALRVEDLKLALDVLDLKQSNLFSCIGRTTQEGLKVVEAVEGAAEPLVRGGRVGTSLRD